MRFVARPRWYHTLGSTAKALWDAGFNTTLVQSDGYEPKFDPFEWYRKKLVSTKEQSKRFAQVEDTSFVSNAVILSTSEEIDNLSMLLAIRVAAKAVETNNAVAVVNLGEPDALPYLRHEFTHRDGFDLVVAHNFTEGSTKERAQVARDFCTMPLDTMKILVSVGKPLDIARKLYWRQFAAAFYQGQVLFETRNGERTSRRVTRVEER